MCWKKSVRADDKTGYSFYVVQPTNLCGGHLLSKTKRSVGGFTKGILIETDGKMDTRIHADKQRDCLVG